jgi:hypothetical protein
MNQTYWEFLKSLSAVEVIGAILFLGVFPFLFCTWAHWEQQSGFPHVEKAVAFFARPYNALLLLVPSVFLFVWAFISRKK